MKTDYLKNYKVIQKFRCGICTPTHSFGSSQEFDGEMDMMKHMLQHCNHLNLAVRIKHGDLNLLCADCSCSFGLDYPINKKQQKFELKNPQDLMEYVKIMETLATDEREKINLVKHILFLQKSWGFYKTKEKIPKMTHKQIENFTHGRIF